MNSFTLGISLAMFVGFVAGCRTTPRAAPATPAVARFFLETSGEQGGLARLPRSGTEIAVGSKPVITEFDIVDVRVVRLELGECLLFELTPAAARDLYRLTASNQGSRLVLLINGAPVGARRIDAPFDDGAILIFIEVPDDTLPTLARDIQASATMLRDAAQK